MNKITFILLLAFPAVCLSWLCSSHKCFHNHHCCSFNCTTRGCVCVPDDGECRVDAACCSKQCTKENKKDKFGTCEQPGKKVTKSDEGETSSSTEGSSTGEEATTLPSTSSETTEVETSTAIEISSTADETSDGPDTTAVDSTTPDAEVADASDTTTTTDTVEEENSSSPVEDTSTTETSSDDARSRIKIWLNKW